MGTEGDCDGHFGPNNPNPSPPSYFFEGNHMDCQIGSISSLSVASKLSAFHWQPNLTHSDQYGKAVLLFHYVPLWKETKDREREIDREKEMMGRPNQEIFRIRFI